MNDTNAIDALSSINESSFFEWMMSIPLHREKKT